ncbi:putative ArsR family transcriptional regulator [Paenarthrobacter nicotinovorans]|uniref:helix-turn-helix transcriptional regulator n=1 Tax=Micrococcaceae TaxID=1268 RepID=UPI000876ED46|nr:MULTISPECIES: transcriptional regulator [Micrococcaceae]MDR6435783.1 putative ArsR family transcriptional regulator [Paenarthrobacter nicotinovorans]SCZ50713.1 Predicted transcriptional regulator, ArsR family [Arthrobacter sp. UNCCL28]
MNGLTWLQRLAAVASLNDTCRRDLYNYVKRAGHAVGRDEAAQAMAIPRSTASFHLDRLVRDGLLSPQFRKTADKAGPGSGRPAKLYVPVVDEVGVSVPPRHYDLAGDLLASAISHSATADVPIAEALAEVAATKGRQIGGDGDFAATLAGLGYEPVPDGEGGYNLLNCPFHRLSQEHREVVCAMNGAFLSGVADTLAADAVEVVPDLGPGHCCARIVTANQTPPS